jgi:hypothetical protein
MYIRTLEHSRFTGVFLKVLKALCDKTSKQRFLQCGAIFDSQIKYGTYDREVRSTARHALHLQFDISPNGIGIRTDCS